MTVKKSITEITNSFSPRFAFHIALLINKDLLQELLTQADLEMVGNSKDKLVTFMVEGEIKESSIVQTFQVSMCQRVLRQTYMPAF